MKFPVGIFIFTVVAAFGSTVITDTQGAEPSTGGGFKQRPGMTIPDANLEPSPRFLLQKITALEKEVGNLKEEVQFLNAHRHNHKRTAIPGGCGWMSVSNFLFQIEKNPTFKTDCGLILGSTTPSKNIPDNMMHNYTSNPVK